jgi:hypothetical protein
VFDIVTTDPVGGLSRLYPRLLVLEHEVVDVAMFVRTLQVFDRIAVEWLKPLTLKYIAFVSLNAQQPEDFTAIAVMTLLDLADDQGVMPGDQALGAAEYFQFVALNIDFDEVDAPSITDLIREERVQRHLIHHVDQNVSSTDHRVGLAQRRQIGRLLGRPGRVQLRVAARAAHRGPDEANVGSAYRGFEIPAMVLAGLEREDLPRFPAQNPGIRPARCAHVDSNVDTVAGQSVNELHLRFGELDPAPDQTAEYAVGRGKMRQESPAKGPDD